ncbi:MAG: hypothetical protein NTX82_01365 [Candidatus Parcubacteria bacterium]|nr:hypothetical protein [Candidatus Parcubacteria bacterium]
MSQSLMLELCFTRGRTTTSGISRWSSQIKALQLTNLELMEKLGFLHSEHDLAYAGIIWGSIGYWVKTENGKVNIACTHNDCLRVWEINEAALLAHAYLPNGFDLDAIPCHYQKVVAKMHLIDRFS